MAMDKFAVVVNGEGWAISKNGNVAGDYLTREAAFEAIVGEASNAIKAGEAVEIVVNKPAIVPDHQE